MAIEVVEVPEDPSHWEVPFSQRCPICNEVVVNLGETPPLIKPCKHVLFIAHSDGFEFCDDRTKENLNIPKDADPNEYAALIFDRDDESKDDFVDAWDSLTSSITIPNSKKLVMRGTMPEESDAYFGFVGDE
jgi:hypothetical protein